LSWRKAGFNFVCRCDAARANDELTAGFLACLYQVVGPSGSAAPVLDPNTPMLIAISTSTFGMLVLLLDNNTSLHSRRVQVLVALKLAPLQRSKKGGFQMDAARESNKLTAIFLACF